MSPLLRRLAPLALVLAASACGPSVDDFCKQAQDAMAQKEFDCLGGSKTVWTKFATQVIVCDDFKKAVAAKRATYDASKADACISAMKASTCAQLQGAQPDACKTAFAGTVAVGGACYGSGLDCAAGSYCAFTNGACPGQCKAYLKVGDDCALGAGTCEPGSSCAYTTKKCVAENAAEGQACDDSKGPLCQGNLRCLTTGSGSAGTCTAGATSGACHYASECAAKYACIGGSTTTAGACAAQKKLAEACTPGKNECETGLHCDGTSKTCVEPPALGGSCDPGTSGEYVTCLDGYCDTATLKCTAFKAPGAACTEFTNECGLMTYCDSSKKCPAVCSEP